LCSLPHHFCAHAVSSLSNLSSSSSSALL
jgi:hypothetical protein